MKTTKTKKRNMRRTTVFAVLQPFLELDSAIRKYPYPDGFADYIAEDEADRVIHFLTQVRQLREHWPSLL